MVHGACMLRAESWGAQALDVLLQGMWTGRIAWPSAAIADVNDLEKLLPKCRCGNIVSVQ